MHNLREGGGKERKEGRERGGRGRRGKEGEERGGGRERGGRGERGVWQLFSEANQDQYLFWSTKTALDCPLLKLLITLQLQ